MEKTKYREVISSKKSTFDLRLYELWNYRDLIWLFVKRDFIAQYKQTLLGPLWIVLQPLLMASVFYVIFGKIASIPTENIHPFLFYFSGLAFWNYFSEGLVKTSNTFLTNAPLFGKVYFPRLSVPLSIVISGLFKLLIHLLILTVLLLVLGWNGIHSVSLDWTLGLIPIYIFLLAMLGLGLGVLLSALTAKYRDLTFLLSFGVQLLMYATPILYPMSFTQGKIRFWLSFNPLTPLMENVRFSLFGVGQFDGVGLLYTTGFALISFLIGITVFKRVEHSFMDHV